MSARYLLINISSERQSFQQFLSLPGEYCQFSWKVLMCNKLFGVNKAFQAVVFIADTELFILQVCYVDGEREALFCGADSFCLLKEWRNGRK